MSFHFISSFFLLQVSLVFASAFQFSRFFIVFQGVLRGLFRGVFKVVFMDFSFFTCFQVCFKFFTAFPWVFKVFKSFQGLAEGFQGFFEGGSGEGGGGEGGFHRVVCGFCFSFLFQGFWFSFKIFCFYKGFSKRFHGFFSGVVSGGCPRGFSRCSMNCASFFSVFIVVVFFSFFRREGEEGSLFPCASLFFPGFFFMLRCDTI